MSNTLPPFIRKPRLGDDIHFVHYIEPIVGQERTAKITWVNEDGTVNIVFWCKDPAEDVNPPGLTDFKFNVQYDATGEIPRRWHYRNECPKGL